MSPREQNRRSSALAVARKVRSAPVGPGPDVTAALRQMDRRRRCGVLNRRLGWVILPIVVLASVLHYGLGFTQGGSNQIVLVLQFVFVPLVAVHAALSFYVFGWVPPSRTLRVFHVWFGYAYAVLVLASQTSWAWPTVHAVLTVLMYVALAAHVGIGIRYARRRREVAVAARHDWR